MRTTNSRNSNILPILNIVAFVVVIAVNAAATALPINGRTTGDISDILSSYFTPAGYVFSIWGLIYLALTGFVVYQALPSQRIRPIFQNKIGWFFVANCIVNAAWIFAWHYGFYVLSVAIMLMILLTLIVIYARLRIGLANQEVSTADYWFVHFPFSLYLGWITVATIANISSVLSYFEWNGFGIAEPTWSAIMMFVAVVVAGILLLNRRDLAYGGVLVWALIGIRAAFIDIPLIATAAVIAAVLVAGLAISGFYLKRDDLH